MPSIDIIQFTPIIGGETTLVQAMQKIFIEMGFKTRVVHPSKSGKKLKNWVEFGDQDYVKISEFEDYIKDTDYLFFINSIHLKKHKKNKDRSETFNVIRPIYSFKGKNVIFYEHGNHSKDLYDYPTIFELLKENDNRVVVFTNTNEVIPFYKRLGYDAHLIRQPFDPDNYPTLKIKSNDVVNIGFNSRYTANKRPDVILKHFDKYLGVDSPFRLNFRGSVRDNCSVWFDLWKYFEDEKIIMHDYAEKPYQIYEGQDYCIYAGYRTSSERGKMEYSMLEAFYYGIPLIVDKVVIEEFKYDEYGISEKDFLESIIPLTEENLQSIIDGTFDPSKHIIKAKSIVNDFLPEMTKQRLTKGLEIFDKAPIERATLF